MLKKSPKLLLRFLTVVDFPQNSPTSNISCHILHILVMCCQVTFFAASHVTLAGKVACDMTSIGCHTYLWDFQANSWSSVVDKLGIRHILPPVWPYRNYV